ncbi:MAG: M48 family metallopeptidase [Salibacteraceae bacterium]
MHAYFIDGKTSKRRICKIEFTPNALNISYSNNENTKVFSEWSIDRIHKIGIISSNFTIRYGDFPHEIIEFQTFEDLKKLIEHYPNASFHKSNYNKFRSHGIKGIAFAIVGVIIFSVLFFVYGTPLLADTFARSIPREYETFIGEKFQYSYLEYLEVDSNKSVQIQNFYNNLHYQSEYPISVVVVESEMINAFALPGGFIVVFTGALEVMETEEELAALLAHEVSHVNNRHSLRTVSRELALYVLLASLTGDAGGFSTVLIENSNMISTMSYSRNFEKEADLEGLKLMMASNLDPNGMIELFKKFEAASKHTSKKISNELGIETDSTTSIQDSTSWVEIPWEKVSEMLSTHPIPKNRIKYLGKEIASVEFKTTTPNDSLKYYFDKLIQATEKK